MCKRIFSFVANNYNRNQAREERRRFSRETSDERDQNEGYRWRNLLTALFLILFVFVCVRRWGFDLCLQIGNESTCRWMFGRELTLVQQGLQMIFRRVWWF
jgi:hypothetical protein